MVEDITSFLDLRSFTCWAVQERRISLPSDSRNIEPQLVVARSTLLTFKNKFSAQLTRSSCTKYFIDGLKYLSPPTYWYTAMAAIRLLSWGRGDDVEDAAAVDEEPVLDQHQDLGPVQYLESQS